jgi:hypothetical protein
VGRSASLADGPLSEMPSSFAEPMGQCLLVNEEASFFIYYLYRNKNGLDNSLSYTTPKKERKK